MEKKREKTGKHVGGGEPSQVDVEVDGRIHKHTRTAAHTKACAKYANTQTPEIPEWASEKKKPIESGGQTGGTNI